MSREAGHAMWHCYTDSNGDFHLNGGVLYDSTEHAMAEHIEITPAPGAANEAVVTFQAKTSRGDNVDFPVEFPVWLSDAATGVGLTATTASGNVVAGAAGTILGTLTTKKAFRCVTDAAGRFVLSITDSAKTGFYLACSLPFANRVRSAWLLTTANYG